jgi:hypothetical protein
MSNVAVWFSPVSASFRRSILTGKSPTIYGKNISRVEALCASQKIHLKIHLRVDVNLIGDFPLIPGAGHPDHDGVEHAGFRCH